jgi:ribosomal-protein-alanine N-acetyltransferase
MHAHHRWTVRPTSSSDQTILSTLLSTAVWKHQHLDWFNALALLGGTSFMLALEDEVPIACLACPPDPPSVSWIRLFAVASDQPASQIWDLLWFETITQAVAAGATQAAALLSDDWLAPILLGCGFEHTNDVILLERWAEAPPSMPPIMGNLRSIHQDDLPAITEVDQRAFGTIWQYSQNTLREVIKQAATATLIEFDDKPVAYQVSTTSIQGAHLARLAVAPEWQGRGLGNALVVDMLHRFTLHGIDRVSVNTQVDNERSLRLYRELGFIQTKKLYPVYQRELVPGTFPG